VTQVLQTRALQVHQQLVQLSVRGSVARLGLFDARRVRLTLRKNPESRPLSGRVAPSLAVRRTGAEHLGGAPPGGPVSGERRKKREGPGPKATHVGAFLILGGAPVRVGPRRNLEPAESPGRPGKKYPRSSVGSLVHLEKLLALTLLGVGRRGRRARGGLAPGGPVRPLGAPRSGVRPPVPAGRAELGPRQEARRASRLPRRPVVRQARPVRSRAGALRVVESLAEPPRRLQVRMALSRRDPAVTGAVSFQLRGRPRVAGAPVPLRPPLARAASHAGGSLPGKSTSGSEVRGPARPQRNSLKEGGAVHFVSDFLFHRVRRLCASHPRRVSARKQRPVGAVAVAGDRLRSARQLCGRRGRQHGRLEVSPRQTKSKSKGAAVNIVTL